MTTTTTLAEYPKTRIRIAVFAFFIAQGLCFATWASRLPDIKAIHGLDDLSHFGYFLTLIPLGKLLAIPIVGVLLHLLNSKITALISLTGFILSLFFVGFASNMFLLGALLFLFGMFWNMTDISLNTQAIEVERMYGKPIIATFHASWSISACVGALIGFVMINANQNPTIHFSILSILCLTLVYTNAKYLQKSNPNEQKEQEVKAEEKQGSKFKMVSLLLVQLGVIWLLALIVENTMFEWSDIYFQKVINAPKSLQIGFLVFMVMMSIGRLLINAAYRIWSKTTVLAVAGACIFAGFLTSSMLIDHVDDITAKVIVNSIGFMLIGLGVSCIVPTLYSIVADKATIPVGTALTIMSSISFAGPFISPLMIGYVSEHWGGMHVAYLVSSAFGLCILAIALFSRTLRRK